MKMVVKSVTATRAHFTDLFTKLYSYELRVF